MTFWPITVRDPNQMELDVAEEKPFPSLQGHLAETYPGKTLSFEELLCADYHSGPWLEPEYRWAVDGMEKEDPQRVEVARNRKTKSGKPATRGIQDPDILTFAEASATGT